MKRKFLLECNKYQNGKITECNGWWEIKDGYCWNRAGGRHQYIPEADNKIVEADDWDDLDYSFLIVKNSDYGWINLQGDFYGCHYRNHAALAELYFHKSEQQLEKEGWIKIYKDFLDGNLTYYAKDWKTTEAQRITLEKHGFDMERHQKIYDSLQKIKQKKK